MSGHDSGIIRRDPREEWIARNRLHPQHVAMVGVGEVRGPTGLIRKNPHATGFIGPNGRKRIDRTGGNQVQLGRSPRQVAKQAAELPLVTVENPDFYVVAVLDMTGGRLTSHDKDILGQGHKLVKSLGGNGAVAAVVFGQTKEEQFDIAGVDRLIHISGAAYDGYNPEQRIVALQAIEGALHPRYWLFPDSSAGGRELGCRLAARLGEWPALHVWQADAQTAVCRGGSNRIDITRSTPRLLVLADECAEPVDETRHQALSITIDTVPASMPRIQDLGPVAVDPSQISLAEAEFILSAGNGVHDWDQFHKAARVLGATEGASRVVVDNGQMPRFRQVGATGTWVTARVYIAVGISGAIQHMQGIEQCGKVVALNLDSGCDMVKRADLAVIGDSQKVLDELIRLVALRQQETSDDAASA